MEQFYVRPTILARANRKRSAQVRVDHPAKILINAVFVSCNLDECKIAESLNQRSSEGIALSPAQLPRNPSTASTNSIGFSSDGACPQSGMMISPVK